MANGLILGLDIGVASVGVGIIEAESGKVIHASSRIFPEANANQNAERRTIRGSRRLTRRKRHRVERVLDLFDTYDIETRFDNLNLNPYELRVKGLDEELSNEELLAALRNIVKRRGISYLDDAEDDANNGKTDYAKSIQENQELLKTRTPGQIQLERLKKYGQLRGDFDIPGENGEPHRIINVFSTSDYVIEARRILETQKSFNTKITDEFIDKFLEILTSKRKYYIGPGNEQSRTDYGVYRTDRPTLKNLFDILIGKCSFYPDEYRAAKASYTAQEYNFLNDLNNLTLPTETKKLSTEQKKTLVEYAKSTAVLGPDKLLKEIARVVGCKKEDIRGFRLDNKDKPDIHTFEVYRTMAKLESIEIKSLSREILDTLAHILTINTDREGIEEAIKDQFNDLFSTEQVTELIQFRKAKSQLFGKGWHSFSLKLMLDLIPELYDTSDEQMTILTRLGKTTANKKETNRTKYIDENSITDEIYNPVVAKSVRQSIKIINAAVKEWGEFDKIVIEMPRDKNEDDKKKRIADGQKANAKEKSDAEKHAASLYNGKDQLPNDVFHGHNQLATKIRLWYQQGERCLYTGKPIDIHDLIHNQQMYEIDHILPLSLSFDDSLSNKVLVLATANQEKGQKTPFQALDSMASAWSYREFKSYVLGCKGLTKKKREYLLTEEDINKIEVRKRFIERNLVDTRFASRVVLNSLQESLKAMGKETKVSVVRGQFTSQLRRKWNIEKSRETYHHHAIDALIVAASSQLRLWKKTENPMFIEYLEGQKVDLETGEILSDSEYKESVFTPPYQGFVNTITSKGFEDEILFSYQVDSKVNRKISDATIYATRKTKLAKDKTEETYVLGKIKDIYSQAGYTAFRKKYDKDKSVFLMYQKDPVTWEKVIEVILNDYCEFDDNGNEVGNPFERYRNENGMIRKYSRKGKGPEIKSLKYYDNKLGNHIDITPDNSKNSVILQSINPWRADLYFNLETLKYELLGLKYSDLSFEKGSGRYSISENRYLQIKELEGISEKSEFKFTLHKNDLILIRDASSGQEQIFRFLSRTMPNQRHYVDLKPYEKAKFDGGQNLIEIFGNVAKGGQCLKSLNKQNISIYKVKTDVLGRKHFIKKEGDKPKLNFNTKSEKNK